MYLYTAVYEVPPPFLVFSYPSASNSGNDLFLLDSNSAVSDLMSNHSILEPIIKLFVFCLQSSLASVRMRCNLGFSISGYLEKGVLIP